MNEEGQMGGERRKGREVEGMDENGGGRGGRDAAEYIPTTRLADRTPQTFLPTILTGLSMLALTSAHWHVNVRGWSRAY